MNGQPHTKRYDVLVIGGFGHVGLPLGLALADADLQVALYDIDAGKRREIENGRMPFLEYDAEPVLRRVIGRSLHVVPGLGAASDSETIVITIGTPVDEYLNPKLLPMMDLGGQLLPHLESGHHIVLRSTVYPGTSSRLYDFFSNKGVDVDLAFCPERIIQGYAIRELGKLPQIVSGFTDEAVRRSEALFRRLNVETIKVSVKEAELAKLFSNAWRYIQFAIANQFYMMAVENGADFHSIHRAMTYGYDRAQDFPKAGFAAGPCLLKDTLQLSAFHRSNFNLGQAAMLINEGLPNFIVETLRGNPDVDLDRQKVGILGMTFKADIDDIRDSLSYKLGKILRFHGAEVLYSDEFAEDPTFVSKEALLEHAEIIIVGVPHSAYRDLEIPESKIVVDLWEVTRR